MQYNEQANALWFAGKPHQALQNYARAVAALVQDAPAKTVLEIKRGYALCLRETGDLTQALALYEDLDAFCDAHALDGTAMRRQWAIALETAGRFRDARAMYGRVAPDDSTPPLDRMKWEHGMGLLNWSEGRLTEAAQNLSAATDAMPDDPHEAAAFLGVYGNDARMSLLLGNDARAYRLLDSMIEVRQAVASVPLASETCLFIARAALAEYNRDYPEEARILLEGVTWIETNDPGEWLHRLDMLARYVTALQKAGRSGDAIGRLEAACADAPFSLAWVGYAVLAQVQIDIDDLAGARNSLRQVLGSAIGQGDPEREAEVVVILANLAHAERRRDAAIFLGKLTLRYLAQISVLLDADQTRRFIDETRKLVDQTMQNLEAAGRFEEALLLERVFERIRRHRLILDRRDQSAIQIDPVPFDKAEGQAEDDWLVWRQELATLRDGSSFEAALQKAGDVLEALMAFRSRSGLTERFSLLPAPVPGVLRLSLVASGNHCRLHCQWHDRDRTARIALSPEAFFALVADLRERTRDLQAWQGPARALYSHLIGPIESELSQITCLEVDGSGVLGRLPMGILTGEAGCLAESVAVRYVAKTAPPLPDPTPREGLVSLVAFDEGPLARDITIGLPVREIRGAAFTRTAAMEILETKPAYVSMATHLDSEPTRPDLSTLTLGDGSPLYLSDLGGEQFDFNGVRIAVFASCSSALNDVTQDDHRSLPAMILEKGVHCVVGTLWDVSESATAAFLGAFWKAVAEDPARDPADILAALQARHAAEARMKAVAASHAGGIGAVSQSLAAENWAGFCVFQSSNSPQRSDTAR